MAKGKTVAVTCTGAAVIAVEELLEFQGELKTITDANMEKLKGIISRHGFNSPVQIWKSGKNNYIVDGHMRLLALRSMESEGWTVPTHVPVDYIEAKSKKHAKEILLSRLAPYGEVTMEGLHGYLAESELDFNVVKESFEIPNIDFDKFEHQYLKTSDEKIEELKKHDDGHSNLVHTCPRCQYRFGKGGTTE